MRALIFQHTVEEVPGTLAEWLDERKIPYFIHGWHLNPPVLNAQDFDWLIVLGGPMNVDDTSDYPWLVEEKAFIRKWLAAGKPYLGLCLGGQLLAQALGAKVERAEQREIGFWKVERKGEAHPALRRWPQEALVYQFHQDRFQLPAGCMSLLASPACPHQAFARGSQVLGLQFHPESTAEWIRGNACAIHRQDGEPFVQTAEQTAAMLPQAVSQLRSLFFQLLDDFVAGWKQT